jgi:hypothetical protein
MARFSPIVRPSFSPTTRSNAKKRKVRKKAAKKRPAKAKRAAATPLKGGKRGKRGGTVKPTGKFEHLRVRPPAHFVKGKLRTVPWSFITNVDERAFVMKKLGLRKIPPGSKVVTGRIKATVKVGRVKGKRVKHLASGVQSLLVPIKGGKVPKSPRGTPRLTKKKARKVAKRARKNPGRLMILNPVPAIVKECVAAMARKRGGKKRAEAFLAYLAKAPPAKRKKIYTGLKRQGSGDRVPRQQGLPRVEEEGHSVPPRV